MRQFRILEGDALAVLGTLASESVHCCITSPPYWSLRDYGCAGQIGLEKTPDEYVARLVAVFREVRRVLKADGTAWVNLGDSYGQASARSGQNNSAHAYEHTNAAFRDERYSGGVNISAKSAGVKPKDLVGIPWRVAFALQADGWYLRSDIIWAKPNPMPESCRDRPTKAHEYIFLLAKSERYFYDADAISEPLSENTHAYGPNGYFGETFRNKQISERQDGRIKPGIPADRSTRNRRTVWTQSTQSFEGAHFATFPEELIRPCVLAGCPLGGVVLDPFAGSGTTGVVALGLDRGFVGIELNPTYAEMARGRIAGDQPLFNAEAPAQELAWTT